MTRRDISDRKVYGQHFEIGLTALMLTLVMASWWSSISYFGNSPPEHLSFYGQDGHCASSEAVGVHCFGDLAAIRYSLMESPNSVEAVYPLTSRLLSFPFVGTANFFGLKVGVSVLSLASVLGTLFCIFLAIQKITRAFPYLLTAACATNVGLLASIDRGNTAAIAAVLFVVGLLLERRHGRWKSVAPVVTALAILNKPTYAVFLLLSGRKFSTRVVSYALGLTLVVYRFGFGGGVKSFRSWVDAALAWSTSVNLANPYPPNYTVRKSSVLVLAVVLFLLFWLFLVIKARFESRRKWELRARPWSIECRFVVALCLYLLLNRVVYAYNLHVLVLLGLFVVTSGGCSSQVEDRHRFAAPIFVALVSFPIIYSPSRGIEELGNQLALHELVFRFAIAIILCRSLYQLVRAKNAN